MVKDKNMSEVNKKIDEVKIVEPKQKIQVDLEVDTSIKDLGINLMQRLYI